MGAIARARLPAATEVVRNSIAAGKIIPFLHRRRARSPVELFLLREGMVKTRKT